MKRILPYLFTLSSLLSIMVFAQSQNVVHYPEQNTTAILIFDTVPTGIAISVNGKASGNTPYQGLNHKIGEKVTLEINDKYYQPYKAELTLTAELTRPKVVQLQLGEGQLLVALNQFVDNTKVFVDDKEMGFAPLKLTLPVGKHNVYVQTPLKKSEVQMVDVVMGEMQQQMFSLEEQSLSQVSKVSTSSNKTTDYTKIGANGKKLENSASRWACVLDNKTGLIWENKQKQASSLGLHNTLYNNQDKYSWVDANTSFVDKVNLVKLCGYSDWRVPSKDELGGLLTCKTSDCEGDGPHINQTYFTNTQSSRYWSSSTYHDLSGVAWGVDFFEGDEIADDKDVTDYVRLVRGGY